MLVGFGPMFSVNEVIILYIVTCDSAPTTPFQALCCISLFLTLLPAHRIIWSVLNTVIFQNWAILISFVAFISWIKEECIYIVRHSLFSELIQLIDDYILLFVT